jgi:hypothetical protein
MKKVALLFLFVFCSISHYLPSQTYHPMLVKGRTWDDFHFAPTLCWTDYAQQIRMGTSDSLVGLTWSHYQYAWVAGSLPDFCPPYSVDTTTWHVAGYELMEDTAARKVFIQSPSMSPVPLIRVHN